MAKRQLGAPQRRSGGGGSSRDLGAPQRRTRGGGARERSSGVREGSGGAPEPERSGGAREQCSGGAPELERRRGAPRCTKRRSGKSGLYKKGARRGRPDGRVSKAEAVKLGEEISRVRSENARLREQVEHLKASFREATDGRARPAGAVVSVAVGESCCGVPWCARTIFELP